MYSQPEREGGRGNSQAHVAWLHSLFRERNIHPLGGENWSFSAIIQPQQLNPSWIFHQLHCEQLAAPSLGGLAGAGTKVAGPSKVGVRDHFRWERKDGRVKKENNTKGKLDCVASAEEGRFAICI